MARPNGTPARWQDDLRAPKAVCRLYKRLGIGTGKRRNAACGPADYALVAARAGLDNTTIESATKRMRRENEVAGGGHGPGGRKAKRVPHPDLTRSVSRAADKDDVVKFFGEELRQTGQVALQSGMAKGTDACAIDTTDNAYYGKGLKEYTRKSRPRAGTSTSVSYMLLHGIGDANIMLAARQFPGGDKLAGCTRSMLVSAARNGVMPTRLLSDRGFFDADCMLLAGEGGRSWITPAPKNERIKRRIREHHEGRLPRASKYTMLNAAGRSVTFTLVILKKDAVDGKEGGDGDGDGDVVSKYVAFATNVSIEEAEEAIWSIPEEYRKRRGIETAIRAAGGITGKTTSNSIAPRLPPFLAPLPSYDPWRIARFADSASGRGGEITTDQFAGRIAEAPGSSVGDRGK